MNDVVTLHATHWAGEAPLLGDYLSAGRRARYGYRIIDVRPITPRTKGGARYEFTCIREKKGDVPPFARVHRWIWNERKSRKEKAYQEKWTG